MIVRFVIDITFVKKLQNTWFFEKQLKRMFYQCNTHNTDVLLNYVTRSRL